METHIVSETTQEFGGIRYYRCGPYFQRKGKRLHRMVWEHHNGKIPKGMAVHHIDGNRANNVLANLDLWPLPRHASYHGKRRDHTAWMASMHRGAAKWHGSPAGLEWHRKHWREDCQEKFSRVVEKVCVWCGVKFGGKPWSLYCGRLCQQRAWLKSDSRICVVCQKPYRCAPNCRQRSCSHACSTALRHREGGFPQSRGG